MIIQKVFYLYFQLIQLYFLTLLVNQIEDLKKLQLIKDSEINKLNEQNLSKWNEITRLKKELNDKTPVDIKQKELELNINLNLTN